MKILVIKVKAENLSEAMTTLVAHNSEMFLSIDQQNSKHPDVVNGKITMNRKSIEWQYHDEARK